MTAAQVPGLMRDLHQRAFAWLLDRTGERYERLVEDRKRSLLGGVRGTVLEIGPGTGANLRWLRADARWLGVDPNPHVAPYLFDEARRLDLRVHFWRGRAESLALPDESVDVVWSTLVLCSVDDPERVIGEIRRVLRPGGRFIFLEHVAADPGTWLRRLQRGIRPVWKALADGCRTDRDTAHRIREAGFRRLELERFHLSLPVVSPHVAGIAWK